MALGIDYNIFLMTRVREEYLKHGTGEGTIRGLVITSAGLLLAATFSALGVTPILFLAQIAFIVRLLLVPALGCDIGKVGWWPSRLCKAADIESDAVAPAARHGG